MRKRICLQGFLLILAFGSAAQTDSLFLKNDDLIVGEIKSMSKGVLTIETDYSKSDFNIEWSGIKKIHSKANFMISLQDRRRFSGHISTGTDDKKVVIRSLEGDTLEVPIEEIVYLKGFKSKFWSRLYGSIDIGINLTKANNLRQYSSNSIIGYVANNWQVDLFYKGLSSAQDSIESTKRTEGGVVVRHSFRKGWFVFASLNLLSNTEQALKLRTTAKAGAGNFIWQTNKSYWALGGGLSSNNETFTNETSKRSSLEGFIASELNIFDAGDLDIYNTINLFPSFTESGRWRVDINLDTKYELPFDLYFKLGLTFNYDNRPAIAGNDVDYVFTFSIGWEFNK